MARRPFDPEERGWKKTEYRQGDVTDAESVTGPGQGRRRGRAPGVRHPERRRRHPRAERGRLAHWSSRQAAKAGAERICYASSVAAYGFHDDNPDWLTEDIPARGSRGAPLLAPEGRGRAGARRGAAAPAGTWPPTRSGPASWPGPARARCSRRSPTTGSARRCPTPVTRLLGLMPALQAGDPRPRRAASSSCTRTTWRRRSWPASRGAASPGPTTSPPAARSRCRDLADALGWYSVPVPQAGGGGHRRGAHPAAADAGLGVAGSTRCASRC